MEKNRFYLVINITAGIGVFAFVYYMYFGMPFNIDGDHFWSISIGRWIMENRSVPQTDPFSWSVDTGWITHQWLFCLIIGYVDTIWNDTGLRLMFIFSVIASLGSSLLVIKHNYNEPLRCVFYFAAVLLIIILGFNLRAYIFTLPLVILLFYLIYFKREERLVYAVPLLILIWVNMHSMAVLFVLFLFFDAALEFVYTRDIRNIRIFFVPVVSFIATLLNPYGINIWLYVLENILEPGHQEFISEWQPADFSNTGLFLIYILFAVSIVKTLNKNNILSNHVSLSIALLTVGSYLYSIYSFRAIVYFVIVFVIFKIYFRARSNTNLLPPASYAAVPLMVMISVVFLAPHVLDPPEDVFASKQWPHGAVEFLKENKSYQENLFNDYLAGGYLMYHGIPTFIDARADLFIEKSVMRDYIHITSIKNDPIEIIEEYNIKNVLISKDTPLFYYLKIHEDFRIVYRDEDYILYTNLPENTT